MATFYWVGGTGTWDNSTTANWSASSGGGSGAGVPGVADTAIFDSGSGSGTITTNYAVSLTTLTLNTGFNGTLVFGATNTFTVSATLSLLQGTLNTNSQAVSAGIFLFGSASTRTLTMGSSAWTITASGSGQGWYANGISLLTITANTAVVTFTGGTGQLNVVGGTNMNGTSFVFNSTNNIIYNGPATVNNLTFNGPAVKTGTLGFNTNTSAITITGTLTLTGASVTNRILFYNALTVGTSLTVTAAAISLSNVDFQDITGAGLAANAAWTGTSMGDCGGNNNITFDAPATQTHTASAGGNWSDNTKWTSRVPLPQDNVVVDVNTTGTLTADMPRLGKDLTFTGFTGTAAFSSTANASYGSLTLASGMTLSGTQIITLSGRGTHTITSATRNWTMPLNQTGPGGTYSLADAMTSGSGNNMVITSGTFNTVNWNMTLNNFAMAGNGATVNLGTSTITVTSSNVANRWSVTAGTLSAASSTIVYGTATTSTGTFIGGGKTYGTLTYTVAGAPGGLIITGANTFSNINIGSGRVLTMPSGATNTVTGTFTANGATNGYVYLPGVSGNYVSTPDSAALSVTGDIDIRVRCALDSWTTATQSLVDKLGAVPNRSYVIRMHSGGTGKPELVWSTDGTTTLSDLCSTAVPFSAGQIGWVRVTLQVNDGSGNHVVKYYTATGSIASPVPADWTQLGGTNTTGGTTNVFDSTHILYVGSDNDNARYTIGKFYRAQVLNGIAGTVAFDADFTTKALGATTFAEGSSNAATVTIAGSQALAGDGEIVANSSTPGTKWYLNTAAASASYVNVQDSTATGAGIPIDDTVGGINSGNNIGWLFAAGGSVGNGSTMWGMGVG